ncbi:MAG: hypothetical protein JWN24_3386 [Phycisphaerales bacterium]|nr:hypothetical protein [Phycisphaerales bacterium]
MHLEPTYTLRLFAEFEGILRDYWAIARPSPRRRLTRMEILMARVAARVNIPTDALAAADLVREHRNEIIHGGSGAQRLTFEASKAALATFISFLPLRW